MEMNETENTKPEDQARPGPSGSAGVSHPNQEETRNDVARWEFLEQKGPLFPPPYKRLPLTVPFLYDGKRVTLSTNSEEVACHYARALISKPDYAKTSVFQKNFFRDWREVMTPKETELIKDLSKCNFTKIINHLKNNKKRDASTPHKRNNEKEKYGYCILNGRRESIENLKIEPPGLFIPKSEHPKMGMLKKRVMPEDVVINCSSNSKIPAPPRGHKWKDVMHDNTVMWLASWVGNVQGVTKYIKLSPSSKLKMNKDRQKYETARKLHTCIDTIRENYRADWEAAEMEARQRAVALYFIDRLALRAGNEKDDDQADTVGCCSLRIEHIELHKEKNGEEYVVVFDFLGKDSIRYYNKVPVEKRVFENLMLFMENKTKSGELFDKLSTQSLNTHLKTFIPDLTAKVFRTYNASMLLQTKLCEYCNIKDIVDYSKNKKIDGENEVMDCSRKERLKNKYWRAMNDVTNLCNHKWKDRVKSYSGPGTRSGKKKLVPKTAISHYTDPRITVAWCKKYSIPIKLIFTTKTLQKKFEWAIKEAEADFIF